MDLYNTDCMTSLQTGSVNQQPKSAQPREARACMVLQLQTVLANYYML